MCLHDPRERSPYVYAELALSRPLESKAEHLARLRNQMNANTVVAEFARVERKFKGSETVEVCGIPLPRDCTLTGIGIGVYQIQADRQRCPGSWIIGD